MLGEAKGMLAASVIAREGGPMFEIAVARLHRSAEVAAQTTVRARYIPSTPRLHSYLPSVTERPCQQRGLHGHR